MSELEAIKHIQNNFELNYFLARKIYIELGLKHATGQDFLDQVQDYIDARPKPFVKWVGGKRQLLKQFRELGLCPPEKFDTEKGIYFEPFVGGGAVFFELLPKQAFLSDMNNDLVITYNTIKTDVEPLISSLKKHEHTKEYFSFIRAQKVSELTPLQIASRFIYLNRTCFNGMYRVNSKGEFNVPFGKYNNPLICDENNLRKVSKVLQCTEIRHQDYKEAIKMAKRGDFVYFDPPYHPLSTTSSFTSYTKENFSAQNQKELRDTFLDLHKRECFVMLSNSSADFIREIYDELKEYGITIHEVYAGRAINSRGGGRGKVKEFLITNY